jgi:hypothetical protein
VRTEFTTKTKALAFDRCKGNCEKCGARLTIGKFRYDHIIPDWMGGDNSLENCCVQCLGCDKPKTASDQKNIAKTKRIRQKHIGIKKKSSFACSKDSKWKKKLDGTVVRR